MQYQAMHHLIGNTPLAELKHLPGEQNRTRGNKILVKLEGNNPAGSVKDRAALSMIQQARQRGEIRPGDTLIEPTVGNTGIALAMTAAIMGYRMILIMPENMTVERRASMRAYGAKLILTPAEGGIEASRDKAQQMEAAGEGKVLDQFSNDSNPLAHYETTAPEIWRDTEGEITHFVSAMGTTGTIMGCSRYFKQQSSAVEIIGVQPEEGAAIPGVRRWSKEYLPRFYDPSRVDRIINISQPAAEESARQLAEKEGIFCGISSGAAVAVALKVAQQNENSTIVTIICDRGDRYLSTGVFAAN